MSTKPTELTEWATDTVANGANSTNNKVEQTPNHKQFGFTFPEPPGRNHFNYWMNAVHKWKEYTVATLDEIGSVFGIDASLSDYDAKTIAFNAGVILRDKTDVIQNYTTVPAKVIIPASNGSHLIYVDEVLGTLETEVWGSAPLDTPNNKIPVYRVNVGLGSITSVFDLRTSLKSTADAGGFITFDPEDIGRIEGGYTDPNTHPAGTPGFFLGKYAGSGNTSEQGISAVNSDTDYLHYYKGNLEVGPDTIITGIDRPGDLKTSINSSMVSRGYIKQQPWLREISRTTYADLFTEIGTSVGTGDGSSTFNIPYSIPDQPALTIPSTTYTATGTYGDIFPTCMAMNPETGDVWVGDGNTGDVYKLTGGVGSFAEVGTYPGTLPTGIWVNPTQGDVWALDATTKLVYKLSRGTGTFASVGNPSTDPRDITGNYITGDIFVCGAENNGSIYKIPNSSSVSEEAHSNLGFAGLNGITLNSYTDDIWILRGSVTAEVFKITGGQGAAELVALPAASATLEDIDVNPETGDVWLSDKTLSTVQVLKKGTGDWVTWGTYPGTNLTAIAVDQTNGDLWTMDATTLTAYRSAGTVNRVAAHSYIKT